MDWNKAMIYVIAVHITYIKTLDFNWQTSTLIQAKEQSAGIMNIEGHAKNDDLSEVHFWEKKRKQTSDLQSTISFCDVPYTFPSVAIGESLLTSLLHFSLLAYTTNLIEAVAVYTNKFQKWKNLIKLSNLRNLQLFANNIEGRISHQKLRN